jgi:CBS domain-containing protein
MDGGRVLRALLAMRMDYLRATQIAASIGQALAFLLGFWGLFVNPLLIFIALFVYLGAAQEARLAQMRDLAQGLPVSAAMVTELRTLPLDATLGDGVDALLRTSQHEFPLLDEVGRVHGILTRDQLLKALKEGDLETPAFDIMNRSVPSVGLHTPFDEAFARMQEAGHPALPVVDEWDRFVGLITTENVGEMMMVRSALGEEGLRQWRQQRRSGVHNT